MTHLSPGQLTAWFEDGRAADRDRVIGHLAECESCRKALAMMTVAAKPEVSSPVVRIEDAVRRGYAARPAAEQPQWSWLRPVYALAGAAALILATIWIATPRPSDVENVVRSAELTAQAPAGATNSLEFKWTSPLQASRYRVTVRDAVGVLVFSGETTASSLAADESIRGKLATMVDYSWTVSAIDADGNVIAESRPRSFTYQP
jgi:hypothetical protein